MEKLCNIKPKRTVFGVGNRPFDCEKTNVRLTGREMEICMASGTVEEVLNDGTTVVLNSKNYNVASEKTITDIDAYLAGLESEDEEPVETVNEAVEDEIPDEEIKG